MATPHPSIKTHPPRNRISGWVFYIQMNINPQFPKIQLIFLILVLISANACNYPGVSSTLPVEQNTAIVDYHRHLALQFHSRQLQPSFRHYKPQLDLAPTTGFSTPVPNTQTPPSNAPQSVNIFLIAVGDNGSSGKIVGCGDSLIPVQLSIPPTQGVLRAALEALLALNDQYYGESGLYNALYASDLQLAGCMRSKTGSQPSS